MNIYELYGKKAEECESLRNSLNTAMVLIKDIKEGTRSIDDITITGTGAKEDE